MSISLVYFSKKSRHTGDVFLDEIKHTRYPMRYLHKPLSAIELTVYYTKTVSCVKSLNFGTKFQLFFGVKKGSIWHLVKVYTNITILILCFQGLPSSPESVANRERLTSWDWCSSTGKRSEFRIKSGASQFGRVTAEVASKGGHQAGCFVFRWVRQMAFANLQLYRGSNQNGKKSQDYVREVGGEVQ